MRSAGARLAVAVVAALLFREMCAAQHIVDSQVLRLTVTIVQVDATVTDRDGRPVTDLTATDFEVLQDGKPQRVVGISYVRTQAPTHEPLPRAGRPARDGLPVPAPPSGPVRRDQVRRTVAIVVDDLGLSFESTYHVRESLKRFVAEQVQPGDFVAILRTSAGTGATQQFTFDKTILHAAVDGIRWYPMGRGGISVFAPLQRDALRPEVGEGQTEAMGPDVDQVREEHFSVGTLGAVNYIVQGLRDLPGRKSIVLFSDGLTLFDRRGERSAEVIEAARRLIDRASRAGVVIYTIDARGLLTLAPTAADDTGDLSGPALMGAARERTDSYLDSQGGLAYLAGQTGGLSLHNSNDLDRSLRRALDDQQGYYLIGYEPPAGTFGPDGARRFRRVQVKVSRPGLRVRSRAGFFGVAESDAKMVAAGTPVERMRAALMSPFARQDIPLRLTSLFGADAKVSFVRSLLHIDARHLTFVPEPDGQQKAQLHVVAATFGDDGRVVDQLDWTYTIRMTSEALERARRQGFVYRTEVPIKKPGPYQLRMALRDSTSDRIGTASQFIVVPEVKKDRVTLSSLILSGSVTDPRLAAREAVPPGGTADPETNENPEGSPAVRIFRPGMWLQHLLVIYNPRRDAATKRPKLEAQILIYKDGRPVYTGTNAAVSVAGAPEEGRVTVGGATRLGTDLAPGQYALQVVVTDTLAKPKHARVQQWMDFELR